ncbi:hypothetical protein ABIB25_002159 [Nakamurella sp. UYEF19]
MRPGPPGTLRPPASRTRRADRREKSRPAVQTPPLPENVHRLDRHPQRRRRPDHAVDQPHRPPLRRPPRRIRHPRPRTTTPTRPRPRWRRDDDRQRTRRKRFAHRGYRRPRLLPLRARPRSSSTAAAPHRVTPNKPKFSSHAATPPKPRTPAFRRRNGSNSTTAPPSSTASARTRTPGPTTKTTKTTKTTRRRKSSTPASKKTSPPPVPTNGSAPRTTTPSDASTPSPTAYNWQPTKPANTPTPTNHRSDGSRQPTTVLTARPDGSP